MHNLLSYPKSQLCSIIEIELHQAVPLLEETFSVLVDLSEMLVDKLNSHLNLRAIKSSSLAAIIPASSVI